ncbi:MAG: thymidylate kinase [Oscillospiraceae bacterium]|jgi:dTMP kinase|nr:thymidylate kinase [Oscillospiraceae bacterium]
MGKLIVLEGIDGSGKSTQLRLLADALTACGLTYRRVAFPGYGTDFAVPLERYLGGALGSDPDDVNAYAASTFFAIDRFASFRTDWGADYASGGAVITDRYTTSNAVHQGAKLVPGARGGFFAWLYDFEFAKIGLPKPDSVLYRRLSADEAVRRLRARALADGSPPDIHERDAEYLARCAETADEAAGALGWTAIGAARRVDAVHNDILAAVLEVLR